MADFDDPLKKLRDRKKQQQKKPFENPLDAVSASQAAKATKSSVMVGQYRQKTLRLPPEYVELMRQVAKEQHMSVSEAERWIVARGLMAYFEDGERPEFEETVQRRVTLPRWDVE